MTLYYHVLLLVACIASFSVATTYDVYILLGQSNMLGHGDIGHLQQVIEEEEEYFYLRNGPNNFARNSKVQITTSEFDVGYATSLTVGLNKNPEYFGPDISLGWTLSKYKRDEFLLVKVAKGGTHLAIEWQSPSAAAQNIDYRTPEGESYADYGTLWQQVMDRWQHIQQYPQRYIRGATSWRMAGIVWWQGWNDAFDEPMRLRYEQNLRYLMQDLQTLFGTNVPIVIGELGQDVSLPEVQQIQEAQLKMKQEFSTVTVVPTSPYVYPSLEQFDGIHHYYGRADTVLQIGTAFAMAFVEEQTTLAPTAVPTTSLIPTTSHAPSLSTKPTSSPTWSSQAPSIMITSQEEFCASLTELEVQMTNNFIQWYGLDFIFNFTCACFPGDTAISIKCDAWYRDGDYQFLYDETMEYSADTGLPHALTWCEYSTQPGATTPHCESYEYCNYQTNRMFCSCVGSLCISCQVCPSGVIAMDCSNNTWALNRNQYETGCYYEEYDGGMSMIEYEFPQIVMTAPTSAPPSAPSAPPTLAPTPDITAAPTSAPTSAPTVAPTQASTSAPTESSSRPSDEEIPPGFCFSGSSTVRVKGQIDPIPLSAVRVGQEVLVRHGHYSRVYAFGHYDSDQIVDHYMAISTSNNSSTAPLILSRDHLVLFQSGQAVSASQIRVGSILYGNQVVTSILTNVQNKGAYAPFTNDGTLVVNDVVASCYVQTVPLLPHVVAHVGVTPFRWYCSIETCHGLDFYEWHFHYKCLVLAMLPVVIVMYGMEQIILKSGSVLFTVGVLLLVALLQRQRHKFVS
eukprot:CAMPEP_0178937650 /NCGR_PEP_ID=MMETSP0786-20121207/25887_1 /TAXON_ID=186022 /ORGANISM="Thalassionema frauenfeldii, Strain CCMP 1798" /LENGTH=792 /DNA_ID=CAMNT_0020616269 /DNA_START=56 /DNA_END=2434 /DNA_ORIENTATION=+